MAEEELTALSGVEIAREASLELSERHILAKHTIAEFAIRAFVAGVSVEQIMVAAGFEASEPTVADLNDGHEFSSLRSIFGMSDIYGDRGPRDPREAFASWLGGEVTRMVQETTRS